MLAGRSSKSPTVITLSSWNRTQTMKYAISGAAIIAGALDCLLKCKNDNLGLERKEMEFRELILKRISELGIKKFTTVAKLCGTSPSHISQVVRGTTGVRDTVCDKIINGLKLDPIEAVAAYKEDCKQRYEKMRLKQSQNFQKELEVQETLPDKITVMGVDSSIAIKPHFHCALCGIEIPSTEKSTWGHPDCDNYFKMIVIPSPKNSIINSNTLIECFICPECTNDIIKKVLQDNIVNIEEL
jgi:hypothetical protein